MAPAREERARKHVGQRAWAAEQVFSVCPAAADYQQHKKRVFLVLEWVSSWLEVLVLALCLRLSVCWTFDVALENYFGCAWREEWELP